MKIDTKDAELFKKIGNDIFSNKDERLILSKCEEEIIQFSGRYPPSRGGVGYGSDPYDHVYQELICLLLNDETIIHDVFWDSFVVMSVADKDIENPFSLKELITILELVESHSKKNKTEDSKKLLNHLQSFIDANGLLRQSSKLQIEIGEILDLHPGKLGAIANIYIPPEYKSKIIERYKQTLKRSIFLINGIAPIVGDPYAENLDLTEPDKKELQTLKKHQLITDTKELHLQTYRNILSDAFFLKKVKTDSERSTENNDFASQIDVVLDDLAEFRSKTMGYFREDVRSDDRSKLINARPNFYRLIVHSAIDKSPLINEKNQLPNQRILKGIFARAIEHLVLSLISRKSLNRSLEINGDIYVRDLCQIAGIKNPKSIINENRRDPKGKKKNPLFNEIDPETKEDRSPSSTPVDSRAAAEWLKDDARKNPYEEREDITFEEEITLEEIKELREDLR